MCTFPHLSFKLPAALALAAMSLSACGSASSKDSAASTEADGAVRVEWVAAEVGGQCQPQRVARVHVPSSELYMIRGKEKYTPTQGGPSTNLPLQIQFSGYGDDGQSEDRATTLVKGDVACQDLDVRWIVTECVYTFDSQKGPACPDILVQGQEAFGSFELERRDRNTP